MALTYSLMPPPLASRYSLREARSLVPTLPTMLEMVEKVRTSSELSEEFSSEACWVPLSLLEALIPVSNDDMSSAELVMESG